MSEPAPAPEIRRIGVIGAGQMGRGIAHVCALAGLDVLLTDISPEALAAGRETIDRNLSRQVARGRIREEDKAAALGRIGMAADYAAFGDCDMVIEAATERETVKRDREARRSVPPAEPVLTGREHEASIALERRQASTAVATPTTTAPAPWTPPDPETLDASRRHFLNVSIVSVSAFGLAGFGASVIGFRWRSLGCPIAR